MNDEVINFLQQNKKDIFLFFKEASPYFPSCCMDVSILLKNFIQKYFNVDWTLMRAIKTHYPNGKYFHVWLERNSEIVDFTLFQFYIGNNKFRKIDKETAYSYCIEDIQRGSVIFQKEVYQNIFHNIQHGNYESYLKEYRESPYDIEVNKEQPAKEALMEYLNKCRNLLF